MSYQATLLQDSTAPHISDPKVSIDYHQVRKIIPVAPGQPVAKLKRLAADAAAEPGAMVVEKPEDLLGPGVELTKHNGELQICSRIRGFPAQLDNQIGILDHHIIEGDVNFHTNNLECEGDLMIKGSIMAGFRVRAKNLTVHGNIENAKVECCGNITCFGGIVACQDVPLVCHGSLWCKYLENSLIEVHGNIFIAKSSLHSFLKAGENVILCTPDSVLVGGRCESGQSLYTASLGAKWATPTEIILGCNPFLAQELSTVQGELAALELEMSELQERIEQINTFLRQQEENQASSGEIHQLQEERELNEGKIGILGTRQLELKDRCSRLEKQIAAHKAAVDDIGLEISSHLFSGIQLTIKDTETRILEETGAVKLKLNPENNDEIVAIIEKS